MRGLKNDKLFIIIVVLAAIFFCVYSMFSVRVLIPQARNFGGQLIFDWPDAMANHFFISNFAKTGQFFYHEPLNSVLPGIVHPRSTNIAGVNIVPTGFLGMILVYGWLSKLFGILAALFFTPFFCALTVILFYCLIKKIFNPAIGFISTLLLFTLAPFWYYANLPMLSGGFFVFLIIAGGYFFIAQNRDNFVPSILSGLMIGLAIITRPIEFIWIGILIIAMLIYLSKRISWPQILLFVIGALVPIGVLLIYNHNIYNEYFTFGYLKMNSAKPAIARLPSEFQVQSGSSVLSYLKLVFIPFGFHPRIILLNFNKYFINLIWPYGVLFAAGIVIWLRQKNKRRQEIFFVVTGALIGIWLVFYYGNWLFADSMVLQYNTIASSYARYWLPLYILILPFAAYLLYWIYQLKARKDLKIILIALYILLTALFSFSLVYLTKNDGLLDQKRIIGNYYEQAKKVDSAIEPDSLIITDRADKVFFPQKKVIVFNGDYAIFPLLAKVADKMPVYYFTLRPDKDIEFINKNKIGALGLKFANPALIDAQFRIFKLEKAI